MKWGLGYGVWGRAPARGRGRGGEGWYISSAYQCSHLLVITSSTSYGLGISFKRPHDQTRKNYLLYERLASPVIMGAQ